jgi:hypothetical protein
MQVCVTLSCNAQGASWKPAEAGATFEEQVAWRKSIVLTASVARGDYRKAGTLRALAASLDEQDGIAERDRLHGDATRVKNDAAKYLPFHPI